MFNDYTWQACVPSKFKWMCLDLIVDSWFILFLATSMNRAICDECKYLDWLDKTPRVKWACSLSAHRRRLSWSLRTLKTAMIWICLSRLVWSCLSSHRLLDSSLTEKRCEEPGSGTCQDTLSCAPIGPLSPSRALIGGWLGVTICYQWPSNGTGATLPCQVQARASCGLCHSGE